MGRDMSSRPLSNVAAVFSDIERLELNECTRLAPTGLVQLSTFRIPQIHIDGLGSLPTSSPSTRRLISFQFRFLKNASMYGGRFTP